MQLTDHELGSPVIKVILFYCEFIINPITKMSLTYSYGRLPIKVALEVIYMSISFNPKIL